MQKPGTISASRFLAADAWTKRLLIIRSALKIRPDYAEASCNLASALLSKGDLDGAIARYFACARAVAKSG